MNLSKSSFSIVGLVAFALAGAGCEQKGPAEKAGQKLDQAAEKAGAIMGEAKEALGKKADTTVEYIDDSAITAKIKADILSDPLLKVSQITVTTTNGVVKLSGVVDSQQSIDRSKAIARSVKNVKSVDSELVVKGAE